jgi:hypothetical protein
MRRVSSLFLLLAALSVRGMCPPTPSVCAEYDSASVIFRGRVLQATPVPLAPPTEVTNPDGSKTMIQALSPEGQWDQVRMQVLEVFKGNPGSEITVFGFDQTFHDGGEFLVYGRSEGKLGQFGTSCTRTTPVTVSIFGSVTMGYGAKDIPAISVTVAGAASTRTVSSGADHTYSLNDLLPGAYTVKAVLPRGYTSLDKDTASVTVAPKSCAEINWAIRHDTHIRGRVTDSSGNPAPDAWVGLLRPWDSRTGYEVVSSQGTDASGHYDFSKADPGDYWVALYYDGPDNIQPYVPVYYPSGSSHASAQLIHLGDAGTQDNINLVLGPVLHPVNVQLRVVNPDGSPVSNATVLANDPVSPVHSLDAKADANGDAHITLYEGREYRLVANGFGNREPACTAPVKFVAKDGLQLGTLTLDKTIDECRTIQHSN